MSSSWKRVIKLVLSDRIVDNSVVTNVFAVGINIENLIVVMSLVFDDRSVSKCQWITEIPTYCESRTSDYYG